MQTNRGRIVAGGARDLNPAQRSAVEAAGEIPARLPGKHAEITALHEAARRGLTPQAIATSWDICEECAEAIIKSGGRLTGPRTAVWPRRRR